MGKILNNFVLGTAAATAVIGKNIGKTIIGDQELDRLREKVKEKTKELKEFIDSSKDKLSRDIYFTSKAKFTSFDAKLTRITKLKEMKDLEFEVKKTLDHLKRLAK